MIYFLLGFCLFFSILNTVVLFLISIWIVNLRTLIFESFKDLVELVVSFYDKEDAVPKNWEEEFMKSPEEK